MSQNVFKNKTFKLKMSKSWVNISFLFLLSKILNSVGNTTLLSLSICDVIEKFYSKFSRNIDIIDINGSQSELVGKILENLNNSMTVNAIRRKPLTSYLPNNSKILSTSTSDFQSSTNDASQ